MTRWLGALVWALAPNVAIAAGPGGVAEGFGSDDWLAKWPLLAVVLSTVVVCTTYFTVKMIRHRRTAREGSEQ